MNRREFITEGAAALVAAGMVSGCTSLGSKGGFKMTNKDFYKGGTFDENGINKGGTFDVEKATQAYFDTFEKLGYPIYPVLKDGNLQPNAGLRLWVVDFKSGDFMRYGMGGILWVNEIREEYFGHDIYLLPNQALPEHSHVATHIKTKDFWTGKEYVKDLPPKMESWFVRHGWVWGFSEIGEPNLDKYPEAKKHLSPLLLQTNPKTGKPYLQSVHVEKWTADGVAHKLPKEGSWHFMMAGDEGAVVSEFANYHDGNGLRFSLPSAGF